jgi:hypothetical protein
MFGGFAGTDEDHGNVPPVALFENSIVFDIHYTKHGAEFPQQRRNGRSSFFAKMAARPGVERYLARSSGGQARVFQMLLHGFGGEYF